MLDRTVAPPYRKISEISLVEATRHQLDGGINLYTIDAGSQDVLKLEFIFNQGSKNDDKLGTSFFLTKMLAGGTKQTSATKIAQTLEYYGAHLDFNPGFDRSNLSVYLLTKHLTSVLPLLLEMILESIFPDRELSLQKSIKKDELRVNLGKTQFVASRKIRQNIFDTSHPYSRSLNPDDIEEILPQDLIDQYKGSASSLTIIASGKIGEATISSLKETFQTLRPTHQNDAERSIGKTKTPLFVDEWEGAMQSSVRMGKQTINKAHKDFFPYLVANELLGGFFGSRLMKNIREDKGFTYGIYSQIMHLEEASMQIIGTDVKRAFTQQTLDEINREIKIIQSVPVNDDELETVKNYMQGSFLSSFSTPFSLASKFKSIHFHGLDYSFYRNYLANIEAVSAEDVLEAANTYMATDDFSTVVIGGLRPN
ncbi:MAG: pitrilysin family protein [Cyclobacteriaceae bacterium]